MVKVYLLHSWPFINSHFYFLIFVELVTLNCDSCAFQNCDSYAFQNCDSYAFQNCDSCFPKLWLICFPKLWLICFPKLWLICFPKLFPSLLPYSHPLLMFLANQWNHHCSCPFDNFEALCTIFCYAALSLCHSLMSV